jgi:leucyl aminopeptidase (aminopeptidase T)
MLEFAAAGRATRALCGFLLWTFPACSQERPPAPGAHEATTGHVGREPRVAEQLVDGLFRVAPGDQVVLRGGPRNLPMMEAIAIEVLGAGGKAHILTTTDGERHYRAERLPIEYLGPPPSSIDSALILESDLEINLPYDSDFRTIWPDLNSERFKRHQRSNPILNALNERSTRRYLYLAMPSQAEVVAAIKNVGLDSATYATLWWEAAAANVESMAERGATIHRRLEQAKQVRVKTADGTDLTFTPSKHPVHVDVAAMSRVAAQGQPWARRQASFPLGVLTVIPVEATANGPVRAAADQCDRPVSREAFEVRAGRPVGIRAASDEACVQGGLGKAGAMGFLSIGLNPAMKPALSPNGNFFPEQSLGLVSLGFGDNARFGGTNTAPRWVVPLTRATVLVDDVAVIRDGQLVVGTGGS